jgi:hypothetical protein
VKFEPIAHVEPGPPHQRERFGVLTSQSVSTRQLLAVLLLFLLAANQLLLFFLETAPAIALAAGAASATLFLFMLRLPMPDQPRVSVGRLAGCIALAGLLLVLGGEGRLAYANTDWQIRDAVLRDMTVHPWPYAYTGRGALELLRAPAGMYLMPALAGKLGGIGVAQAALLAQNAVLLGIVLALGSMLAATARARLVLAAVAVAFSGMDFLGMLSLDPATAMNMTAHLEAWGTIQFSSHITLAFWVPQHAIAGWAGAVLFLLWARGRLPLFAFLAPLPLLALWSPLALMGLMPFAAAAGFTALLRRELKAADVALPALAAALALPALLYLQAAGDSVGLRAYPLRPLGWLYFQLFETVPFILGVALLAKGRQPKLLLALAACWLAVVPFIQIGTSSDFMMRASIPALAVLAVLVAEALASSGGDYKADGRLPRALLLFTLAVGAVTGAHEVARALLYRPTPLTRCDLIETTVAHAGPKAPAGMSTYLAPVTAIPAPLRPKRVKPVARTAGVTCWERPWKVRR